MFARKGPHGPDAADHTEEPDGEDYEPGQTVIAGAELNVGKSLLRMTPRTDDISGAIPGKMSKSAPNRSLLLRFFRCSAVSEERLNSCLGEFGTT